METVFLSYTYRPHPDHEANLERLRRYVVRAVEAMNLRIVDGVDVGGRALDAALRQKIKDSDALIALVTPQAADVGFDLIAPSFVLSEFDWAKGQETPTIRAWHHLLPMPAAGAGDEHVTYFPGKELDVILKLINTIALWKRDYGRRARVRIEPADLAARYDESRGDKCEFQLITSDGEYRKFREARLWQEPGAAYVLLPKLREGERVRLCVHQGGKTWQSRQALIPLSAELPSWRGSHELPHSARFRVYRQ
jgi:hypothetical protein